MKDVFSVKRSADSDDVLKSLNGHFMQTIDVAAATTLEDVDSGKSIINFGETDNSTRLSTDSDGMFFDFHMDILPPGRTYFFEYLIIDRNVRKIVKDKNAAFRVK